MSAFPITCSDRVCNPAATVGVASNTLNNLGSRGWKPAQNTANSLHGIEEAGRRGCVSKFNERIIVAATYNGGCGIRPSTRKSNS